MLLSCCVIFLTCDKKRRFSTTSLSARGRSAPFLILCFPPYPQWPAGTPCHSVDVLSLRKWWAGRGIPASRSGLEHALEALHVPYAELLLVKCSGLSLSDQYWVTPCDAPQRWHDVNFYENDFSDDVGRALFGEGVLSAQPDLCSPCNTSDGFLQKRWRIADRKRILLKAGSGIYQQEYKILRNN